MYHTTLSGRPDGRAMKPVVPAIKRLIDISFAVIALLVLAPLMIIVAVAIRMHDGGPILFRQIRIGRGGRPFGVWKFRSMTIDAESDFVGLAHINERHGPLFKMTHDPRVTRLGHFLRKSSIDELPQLWNVVRGQMSLVGPRPALPSEVAHFPVKLLVREHVMPGITGLWQVEARHNPSFEAYIGYDMDYVANWSIMLDLMILAATIRQIFRRLKRGRNDNQVHHDRSSD